MYKKIIIGIVSSVVLILILFVLFINIYKDELISLLKDRINATNTLIIKYKSIDLESLWFLHTLTFQVKEPEVAFPNNKSKKLITASKIDIKINLLSALKKEINFSKITVVDGSLNIDSLFLSYFTTANQDSEKFVFDFNKVILKNVVVNYSPTSTFNVLIYLNSSTISGNFTPSLGLFDIIAKSDSVHYNGSNLGLLNRKMEFHGLIKSTENEIFIEKSSFVYEDIIFNIGLVYSFTNDSLQINLTNSNISLKKHSDILKQFGVPEFNRGKLRFHFVYKTDLTKIESDNVRVDFNVSNAVLGGKDFNGLNMQDIEGEYYYSNGGRKNLIILKRFDAKWNGAFVSGSLKINNLHKPKILINSSFNVSEDFFINQRLSYSGRFNGKIKAIVEADKQFSFNSLNLRRISSSFTFENVSFEGSDLFKLLLGNVIIEDNNCNVDFSGHLDGSKIKGSVFVPYFISALNTKNFSFTNVDFEAESLNLDRIINSFPTNKRDSINNKHEFNHKICGKVNEVIFKNNTLNNIRFNIEYAHNFIKVSSFDFVYHDGKVNGNANFTGNSVLHLSAKLSNIDIGKTSNQLAKNFNQLDLSKYLSGHLTGNMNFSGNIDSIRSKKFGSLDMRCLFTINNGKLFNLKQLEKISSITKLKEIETIEFSTLNNTILISNKEISIPEMEILSNLLNLKISGIHTLGGGYNYYLNFKLSNLLGKQYKTNVSATEYTIDESDRVNLFFRIRGVGSNYSITYDTKNAFNNFKNNAINDSKLIKSKIIEDFFKKEKVVDSTTRFQKNKSDTLNNKIVPTTFRIEWEELDTARIK